MEMKDVRKMEPRAGNWLVPQREDVVASFLLFPTVWNHCLRWTRGSRSILWVTYWQIQIPAVPSSIPL